MDSHWSYYIKERFGFETLSREWGFVNYSFAPPYIALQDIYVRPEFRKSFKGLEFLAEINRIGREAGMTHIWTQVSLLDKGAARAVRCNLACGFQMISAAENKIIFQKEIGG